jgi:competence CoiA-like predicted nuclease
MSSKGGFDPQYQRPDIWVGHASILLLVPQQRFAPSPLLVQQISLRTSPGKGDGIIPIWLMQIASNS